MKETRGSLRPGGTKLSLALLAEMSPYNESRALSPLLRRCDLSGASAISLSFLVTDSYL